MSKITRLTLDRVNELEQELSTFHGLRHFWANHVANYSASVFANGPIDADVLMKEQEARLRRVAGIALSIFDMMYPDAEPPNQNFRRVTPEERNDD